MIPNFIKNLDADDIFISYSRDDGKPYLKGLDAALSNEGFSCFTDRRGTDADPLPPKTLFEKIRRCKTLVLLGSPGALDDPENILPEVREFAEANGTARIIGISFDADKQFEDWASIPWLKKYVEGKAREREVSGALTTGKPSDDIVEAIVTVSNYMKGKDRLRKYRNRAFAGFVILAAAAAAAFGAAIYGFKSAAAAADEAVAARTRADIDIKNANMEVSDTRAQAEIDKKAARDEAETQIKAAQDLAAAKIAEAETLTRQAEDKRVAAENAKAVAEGLRDKARAEAQMQGGIAESRSLASRSQTLLRRQPHALIRSINLAVDAMAEGSRHGVHTVESDTALRESLRLLPHKVAGRHYKGVDDEDITSTALSPDGKYFANRVGETIRIYVRGEETPFKTITCELCGDIALSNDASFLADGSDAETAIYNLNEAGTAANKLTISGGEGSKGHILRIALSPGGRYLAAIFGEEPEPGNEDEEDNTAVVWDIENRKQVSQIAAGQVSHEIAFSQYGDLGLASGTKFRAKDPTPSGLVMIWGLGNKFYGKQESAVLLTADDFMSPELHFHRKPVRAVAVGVNGSYATDTEIWSPDETSSLKISTVLPTKEDAASAISHLAFAESDTKLVAVRLTEKKADDENVSIERELEVWDAAQRFGDETRIFVPKRAASVGFLPDNDAVAAAFYEDEAGNPRVFGASTGRERGAQQPSDEAEARDVFFISSDARFALFVDGGSVHLRDAWQSRTFELDFPHELTDDQWQATVSIDGRFVVLAGGTGSPTAFVYEFRNGKYEEKKQIELKEVYGRFFSSPGWPLAYRSHLAITPNGEYLLTNVADGARLWSIATGDDVTPPFLLGLGQKDGEKPNALRGVELSPSGHYLAVAYDPDVPVGEPQVDPEIALMQRDRDTPLSMMKRPAKVAVIRIPDGSVVTTISHDQHLLAIKFSPLDRYVLTSAFDRVTTVTDLRTRSSSPPLASDFHVTASAFSFDERYVAIGSGETTLVFETGKRQMQIATLPDSGLVTAIGFSMDNSRLVTASKRYNVSSGDHKQDHPLRIWLLESKALTSRAKKQIGDLPGYLRE